MSKYRRREEKIRQLEREMEMLKQSIDISLGLYEDLQKERVSYRRIIKYSTMLMLLMNLITSNSGDTDIGSVLKRNIQEFYRSLNNDLMQIPTDDNEIIDNVFEDEEEGYDDGEVYDIWDAEKKFG